MSPIPMIPISILDLSLVDAGSDGPQALRNTIAIARAADRLGYHRFWMAEHHNTTGIASSTPELMIGQVARETERIRVGSGGIMLPNHVPLKVVETFRVLEALYPGRIDLGIGRAPGTDTLTAFALRRSTEALRADDYPQLLLEMFAFDDGTFPDDHPFRAITPAPGGVRLPPVWLLGSSDYSARLAAQLGLGFAFAAHINAAGAVPAMRLYRDNFEPSDRLAEPHAILTVSVVVGDTPEHAEELALTRDVSMIRLRRGQHGPILDLEAARAFPATPEEFAQARAARASHPIGTAEAVGDRILVLAAETRADEVMVSSMVYGHDRRLRTYKSLADQFALAGTRSPALATAR